MRLLWVEHDRQLRVSCLPSLSRAGYTVVVCEFLRQAEEALAEQPFDVILLDRRLPDGDGLQLLQAASPAESTPFVVASTAASEDHIVETLDGGAWLYLKKPLGPRELVAQLNAVLRRRQSHRVTFGPVAFDRDRLTLRRPEGTTDLSTQQALLFQELVRSPNSYIARQVLFDSIWLGEVPEENCLDSLVRALRRKLGSVRWMLRTQRSKGYGLFAQPLLRPVRKRRRSSRRGAGAA